MTLHIFFRAACLIHNDRHLSFVWWRVYEISIIFYFTFLFSILALLFVSVYSASETVQEIVRIKKCSHYCSDKGLKGTVVNLVRPSLNGIYNNSPIKHFQFTHPLTSYVLISWNMDLKSEYFQFTHPLTSYVLISWTMDLKSKFSIVLVNYQEPELSRTWTKPALNWKSAFSWQCFYCMFTIRKHWLFEGNERN